MSGDALKGPNDPLLVDSTVYPKGTVEQFPAAWPNEGHFYMECSNKGLCERESGLCQCFPGYDGTACQRASCPNDCSGHGTCETIKELAEDKETGDEVDGIGDLSGIGYLRYELWDKTLTMGCKCDAGYNGPDCSARMCRFGVDPLFIPKDYEFSSTNPFVAGLGKKYDSSTANVANAAADGTANQLDAPSYEKSFVEISSESHYLRGTFDLTLFDVYGDKFILDGLNYADYASPNFEGYAPHTTTKEGNAHTANTAGTHTEFFLRPNQNFGGGASNFSSCFDIMQRIPNRKLKDTLGHGTYHHGADNNGNNMPKNYGGLVGSAYVNTPSNMRPQTPGYFHASTTHAHVPHSYYIAKTTPFCNATYPLFSPYGIRYDFNYNRGNPGYHKDLYINNVQKDLNYRESWVAAADVDVTSRIMAFGYYATDRQGEVAEYLRVDLSQTEALVAADFGITLPGYAYATDGAAAGTITFSSDVSQYLTKYTGNTELVTSATSKYVYKGQFVWYAGKAYEIDSLANEWFIVDATQWSGGWWDTDLKTGRTAFAAGAGLNDAGARAGAAGSDATYKPEDFEIMAEVQEVSVKTRRTVITIVDSPAYPGGKVVGNKASLVADGPGGADLTKGFGKPKVKTNLVQRYQYVSECSNRGSCDRESGTCLCYAGYTHDNCDTQAPVC
jgi:hypothetical protein